MNYLISLVIFTHVSYCQKASIENQQDSEKEKSDTESGQADANFWKILGHINGW